MNSFCSSFSVWVPTALTHFEEENMKKCLLAIAVFFALTSPAVAKINVVATLPWIGNLAALMGKEAVEIKVLVKPQQDPHQIEAKPTMMLAARHADILMYNGLDLEIGYLPRIIESSANPAIQPGRPGHLDCSQFIDAIEKQTTGDRSLGDVHPLGNPHYHLSSRNILKIAQGMTGALSRLDPGNAAFFRSNLSAFASRLQEERKRWSGMNLRGKRFVAYHRFFEYLALEQGFSVTAYVEDKPGIPPSAGHVDKLTEFIIRTQPDAILTTGYFGQRDIQALSRKTGVKSIVVPHDVGAGPGTSDWFALMQTVLTVLQ